MRGEIIQMDSTGLIYQECLRVLQSGHDVVLATIFEARGSAPRTAGAKMVVRSDGTTLGTIGGGRLENDVIDVARRLFVSRRSAIHSFDLTGKDLAAMDMICGGCGEVWLHFLTAADSNDLAVCQATVGVLSRRESGCLITEISDSNGARDRQFCLIGPDNSATGRLTIGDRRLDRWIGRSGKFSARTETFNDQRFLIEPIQPCCTAFIFGGGHVSQQVVPLCETVDFRTVVLDDREEYACRRRFPAASDIRVLESFEKWEGLPIDEKSFIIIMTRGHMFDKVALAKALRTTAVYIGMIGSRRKRDMIYKSLREEGFSPSDLERVYSPIGLDIAAETPAELAVSIVGELIRVRAAQKRREGA